MELTAFDGIIGRSNAIPLRLSNRKNSRSHLCLNVSVISSSQSSVLLTVSRIRFLVPASTGARRPRMSKGAAALEAHILRVNFGQKLCKLSRSVLKSPDALKICVFLSNLPRRTFPKWSGGIRTETASTSGNHSDPPTSMQSPSSDTISEGFCPDTVHCLHFNPTSLNSLSAVLINAVQSSRFTLLSPMSST